jgi:predicted phage terminase large subunit-like protein
VGGVLTGEGAQIIVVDDPHNTIEIESEAERENVLRWWDEALSTRLNDPRTGAIVAIMQRLHEDDLTGHILSRDSAREWVHLMLPMRHDPRRHCVTALPWEDPRSTDGELLWPERFGEAEVRRLERELGSYGAAGQLQQAPAPRGGGLFKKQWWQLWPPDGEEFDATGAALQPLFYPKMECVVASLDTALTTKTENDWSALTVWGMWRDTGGLSWYKNGGERIDPLRQIGAPKIMLMSAWQDRLEFHALVDRVIATCRKRKVDRLLIEAKTAGHSVAQEIVRLCGREEFGVTLINPGAQDKVARAYSVQHLFENGLVYAPDRDWAELVIREMATFPKGKHDDLTDTATQAVKFLRDSGMAMLLPEAEERAVEEFGPPGDTEADEGRLYDV